MRHSFRSLDPTCEVRDNGLMDSEDLKAELRSPQFMTAVFVKRPQLYVGIFDPSAEQWRLSLDSMSMAAGLAGVRAEWSPEDREAMARY